MQPPGLKRGVTQLPLLFVLHCKLCPFLLCYLQKENCSVFSGPLETLTHESQRVVCVAKGAAWRHAVRCWAAVARAKRAGVGCSQGLSLGGGAGACRPALD